MTITESEAYTIELLQEHLPEDWHNWKIYFFYSNKTLGRTHYPSKVIEISLWLIQNTTTEDVKTVIKHEVAHAIAFNTFGNVGHGQIWVWICKYFVICAAEKTIKVTKVD